MQSRCQHSASIVLKLQWTIFNIDSHYDRVLIFIDGGFHIESTFGCFVHEVGQDPLEDSFDFKWVFIKEGSYYVFSELLEFFRGKLLPYCVDHRTAKYLILDCKHVMDSHIQLKWFLMQKMLFLYLLHNFTSQFCEEGILQNPWTQPTKHALIYFEWIPK